MLDDRKVSDPGASPGWSMTQAAVSETIISTETEKERITIMEILASNKELTKQEIYFLTKAQDTMKMTDAVDQTLDIVAWAIYTDTNSNGEEVELFAMRTDDGETYATNSSTFIAAFRDILDVFDPDEIKRIKVLSGTSKNNRTFVTCAYAD